MGLATCKPFVHNCFLMASNHMLGPKPFALDRMMAIYYAVVEGRVAPTANIFMQISSLVSLNLLGHVASDDQIDSPKYKCLVSLDFIKSVSRTVNFEVMRYLFDFV
ncbi:origin recognition complex subunit 5 [Mytilus galloprovincialis]|uniref:Origin recognition complex subunit 5 n=1 Tax=Mytilus galloprovincialis TaxID=29158 RepID=A0A8B6H1G5_MYTGA|nr:origin recognition complex subunit 5 [Mytilus galloprovincialis]